MTLAFSSESYQPSSNVQDLSAPSPDLSESPELVEVLAPGPKLAAERAILGFIRDFRQFRSVVDFGCGIGNWLNVARELGATEIRGYDTAEILVAARDLTTADFFAANLTRFIDVEKRFDIAICLETADQLPPEAAVPLVRTLCSAADWVLFGAAPPFQEGGVQVNGNWVEYWAGLFLNEGFLCYDILRSVFWHDRDIAFYFRQNTCLYVRRGAHDALSSRGMEPSVCPPSMIHPELFLKLMSWISSRRALATDSRIYAEDLTMFYERSKCIPDPVAETAPVVSSSPK